MHIYGVLHGHRHAKTNTKQYEEDDDDDDELIYAQTRHTTDDVRLIIDQCFQDKNDRLNELIV